jgi:TonB family protein
MEPVMKIKLIPLALVTLLAGCSLLSTPTGTVKKFMAAAEKGDALAMTQLFSQQAVQRFGIDRIRTNNQQFADNAKAAISASGKFHMENLKETTTATGRRVSFLYRSEKGDQSLPLVFDLSKESGTWKIDNVGGSAQQNQDASARPTPTVPDVIEPPPPPLNPNNQSASTNNRAPISGGVLNNKAITLPKPAYPPVARAARAAGTVVVQVIVDENGNVISARAVSGHPLLQAAAIAAARAAKFTPTKLAGQPVKITGVITYQFTAE